MPLHKRNLQTVQTRIKIRTFKNYIPGFPGENLVFSRGKTHKNCKIQGGFDTGSQEGQPFIYAL